MKAMTFNLRFETDADGDNAWRFRKELAVEVIRRHQPDLIGVQEALQGQMDYLTTALPDYTAIGIGREEGGVGEYCAIFYRTAGHTCLRSETFWISETPQQPGRRGWDANNVRICTWGEFVDEAGVTYFAFNTHLDHMGMVARREGARLLLQHIDSVAAGRPVVLTGDFNCTPADEPYEILTGAGAAPYTPLVDARLLSQTPPTGPAWTFHGYHPPGQKIIDYLFVRDVAGVRSFQTLDDNWDGRYPSDHLPIVAEILL